MSERTPWSVMLRAAQSLGFAPHTFWRLSLREWRSLFATDSGALSRTAFADLLRRFPDNPR